MKTKLFAHRAKGRLAVMLVLAAIGAALPAHTAFAQDITTQGPPVAQAQNLDGAGYLGTFSPALGNHSDARVAVFQRDLGAQGISPGPIDGIYGPQTEQAVRRYQQQNGLTVDGIAGIQTFSQLYYGGAQRVSQLQGDVARQGFDPGSADGVYGPKTQQAVTAFQHQNGLRVDGIAGPETLAQLRFLTAKNNPPASPQPLPQAPSSNAQVSKKRADHSLAVVIANVLFAAVLFVIARMVFRRRESKRREVESHLIALAEEEEERYRTQRTPRSRRPEPTRTTSTPWTDQTSELGSSRTAGYAWHRKEGEDL